MIPSDLTSDISNWSRTLSSDLTDYLNIHKDDARLYGLTLELPSDFSNDGIIARIARCPEDFVSQLHSTKSSQIKGDWDYDPRGFGASCDGLQELYDKYKTELQTEVFYQQFGNELYEQCLAVMLNSLNAGELKNIRMRFLSLSDDDHPIVERSIEALNDDETQKVLRRLI